MSRHERQPNTGECPSTIKQTNRAWLRAFRDIRHLQSSTSTPRHALHLLVGNVMLIVSPDARRRQGCRVPNLQGVSQAPGEEGRKSNPCGCLPLVLQEDVVGRGGDWRRSPFRRCLTSARPRRQYPDIPVPVLDGTQGWKLWKNGSARPHAGVGVLRLGTSPAQTMGFLPA